MLAEILLHDGRWALAEAELRTASAQAPERLDLKISLARAVGGDPARLQVALAMLEEVAASPEVALTELLPLFDFLRKRAQDEAAAERIIRRAIELFPLNVQARQPLIDLLLHQGRKAEAIDQLRAAIGGSRSYPGLCLQLAALLDEAGARDEARSYIERALLKEPRNRQALDMLAALAGPDAASPPRPSVLAEG